MDFTLREASTEQNNNKSIGNLERRFKLIEEDALSIEGETLHIYFNYEPVEKSIKQDDLTKIALENLEKVVPKEFYEVLAKRPTEKNKNRTLLEKHLRDYTARNSFDYFIHKDLGKFLNRELDFFIKNELLVIDDIDTKDDAVQHMTAQFAKIVAVKRIAQKIIAFLAQLEDFQRSLWLKKKFVTETQYCLTLDRIPQAFYAEITTNTQQVEEWINLFKIDKIGQNIEGGLFPKQAFSKPLSITFLNENPFLVLDTKHFSTDFKMRLLAELPDLDANTEGVLLHSDNFQALIFLQERYKEQVKTIYIDPPYNTNATEILYKNEYKHSSWMSLIYDRIEQSQLLMKSDACFCLTIDDYEYFRVFEILMALFGEENHLATVPIRINPSGRATVKGFAVNHEYAVFFAKSDNFNGVGRLPHSQEQIGRYDEIDGNSKRFEWENFKKNGSDSNKKDRPKQFYPILYDKQTRKLRLPEMEWDNTEGWILGEEVGINEVSLLPINSDGVEKVWRYGVEKVKTSPSELSIKELKDGSFEIYRKKYLNEQGSLPGTWWDNQLYSAGDHGTRTLTNLFGISHSFSFPKSVHATKDCIKVSNIEQNSTILDYFAGSGTTGHAVINLNREDGGKRKYILVEQGEYFDTVLLPRLKKVIYAKDWKNGSPLSTDTGVSHCIKYLRLESYEDTLNNLSLARSEAQELALGQSAAFKESYFLNYLFEAESRSALWNVTQFENPFDVRLRLLRQNEEREQVIDVVETFNYLLGLVVEKTWQADGFRVVEGKTLKDERILIVWRNCHEKTAEDLNRFFERMDFKVQDREYAKIYVNGEHTLPNTLDETNAPKVVQIEGEFRKRMFERV